MTSTKFYIIQKKILYPKKGKFKILSFSERLSKIKYYLKFLEKAINTPFDDFEKNDELQIIVERSIQVVEQAIIDIGNHIISIGKQGQPNSYREIIVILKRNNIIIDKHFDSIAGLTSLRNILVHDYLNIDVEIIYTDIIDGIEAIKWFIRAIEKKFLDD